MELLMSGFPEAGPSPETLEVAALVERTLAGDTGAFEQIIVRYERRVLTLALKLLGSMDDAQDAAQEVFLRSFKYLHRLDVRRPIEPWLVRTTINVCRNIGRTRQRRWNTFPDVAAPDTPCADKACDPHIGVAEQQERRLMRQALNELPHKERMAIILRDVEGMSTAEVAEILGSSETTVRSQVSRARVRMKEAIERLLGGRP